MARKPIDPGLAQIDAYARAIVEAHDERVQLGAPAEEIAAQRPAVVQLAATIGERLRADYLARQQR